MFRNFMNKAFAFSQLSHASVSYSEEYIFALCIAYQCIPDVILIKAPTTKIRVGSKKHSVLKVHYF